MRRRAPLVLLLLLPFACAKDDSGPEGPEFSVFQVPSERSLGEAVAAAQPGDRIILTPPGSWTGDVVLPPNVDLKRHADYELWDLFLLEGQLRVDGAELGTQIEGLEIVNEDGAGLLLVGSVVDVTNCRIRDCGGPAVELVGRSGAVIQDCNFERSTPAVLIRDVASTGHWEDRTAPKLFENNFLDNLPLDGHGPNLIFQAVSAWDSVYARWNWWGAPSGEVPPEDTIWDNADSPALRGVAEHAGASLGAPDPRYWPE